jgi:hypothetical protein
VPGIGGPGHRRFPVGFCNASFPGSLACGADFQSDPGTGDRPVTCLFNFTAHDQRVTPRGLNLESGRRHEDLLSGAPLRLVDGMIRLAGHQALWLRPSHSRGRRARQGGGRGPSGRAATARPGGFRPG